MAICTGKWVLFLISNLASSVDDGAAATIIIEVNMIRDNKNIFLLIFTVLLLNFFIKYMILICGFGAKFYNKFVTPIYFSDSNFTRSIKILRSLRENAFFYDSQGLLLWFFTIEILNL